MSEVFVGIVVKSSAERVRPVATRLDKCLHVEGMVWSPGVSVLFDRTKRAEFDSDVDKIAAEFSRELDAALVVRCDLSVDLRSSRLYRAGKVNADFGECDEMYLALDDYGERECLPATPSCQLDPLKEYELGANAIELGLSSLLSGMSSMGVWAELRKIIKRI